MKDRNERLMNLRKERGLSLTDLSRLVDIDRTTISKIECGSRLINSKDAIKLATFFGVSVRYLMMESDDIESGMIFGYVKGNMGENKVFEFCSPFHKNLCMKINKLSIEELKIVNQIIDMQIDLNAYKKN